MRLTIVRLLALLAAPMLAASPALARRPVVGDDIGKAEGHCRVGEPGPAVLVDVMGLKDRKGLLKLEVYPLDDDDFLGDDATLVQQGKVFRRVEEPVPAEGAVTLCVRVPGPGSYAISLLHDRDANHKFGWWADGVGFAGNPKLGWRKPKAESARLNAGAGLTRTTIMLNYRHGLGVAPAKDAG